MTKVKEKGRRMEVADMNITSWVRCEEAGRGKRLEPIVGRLRSDPPIFFQAIKEQQRQIEELKAQIDELREKVD